MIPSITAIVLVSGYKVIIQGVIITRVTSLTLLDQNTLTNDGRVLKKMQFLKKTDATL